MQIFNNAELAFLALLSYPKLAVKSLKLCADNAVLFPKVIWPHLAIMWDAYLNTLTLNKKQGLAVGKDIIAANLSEAVQADRYMTEEQLEKSETLLKRFLSGDVPSEEEGVVFVQKVAQLDAGRKIMASLSNNADLMSLEAVINKSKRDISTLEETTSTRSQVVYSPFREIEKLATYSPRIPTGINWMDEITSGGGREGELWLILGPSGGGKSMLTIQYACAQALMGNSVLWCSYEQALEGDLAERIIANVTDESLDRIRDVGFNHLPEDIQRKFWAAVAGADDKLVAMDMTKLTFNPDFDSKDNGGMYSVWQQYNKLKAEGRAPKTIIIDWIGAMMSVIATVTGRDLATGFQFMTQAEIDIARKMAKEEPVQIIFFHQTDTKSQHARPVYIPDKTCALNMKTMANFMDIVITLSNRDVHNILYMSAVKSRKGNTISKTVKLVGDKCRFENAPGWAPDTNGNFYNQKDAMLSDEEPEADSVSSFSREIE